MAFVLPGAHPVSGPNRFASVNEPIFQALNQRLEQNRAKEEQIRQGTILQSVINEIAQKGDESNLTNILGSFAKGQTQGLSPTYAQQYLESAPKFMQEKTRQDILKQKASKPSPQSDPNAQKWAYEQIGKSEGLPALQYSITELRNVTKEYPELIGPRIGKVPAWLSQDQANTIRNKVSALGLQIINTHKSLFPRGITQGEFLNLEKKLPNAQLSPNAMNAVLDVYQRLADIADRKQKALYEATQGGTIYPASLPFEAKRKFEELDNEAYQLAHKANELISGKAGEEKIPQQQISEGAGLPGTPEELGRSQQEKPQVQVKELSTGRIVSMPIEEAQSYLGHPDFSVLENEKDVAPKYPSEDEAWLESEEGLRARDKARAFMRKR